MGINSSLEQLDIIWVYTLPCLLRSPTTGIFPKAPLPLFPLTLLAPKYDSSTSTSPLNPSLLVVRSNILNLNLANNPLMLFLDTLVKREVCDAVKSWEKHFKICLNLASEICVCFKYLFCMSRQPILPPKGG